MRKKQQCPHCGESFKCVNIHIAKKHKIRTRSKKMAKGLLFGVAKKIVLAAIV